MQVYKKNNANDQRKKSANYTILMFIMSSIICIESYIESYNLRTLVPFPY